MAIELTTKFQPYTDEQFAAESKKHLLTNQDFEWTGAHTVKVFKITTSQMNDYNRTGEDTGNGSRYGAVKDLEAPLTKNQLGENYGMKLYAGSAYEWNEQAAAFAAYVTGKTAAEVAGIAVDEKTAPTDADLAATVTIAVGGFQALIAKAAQ